MPRNQLEGKIAELQALVEKQQGTIRSYRLLNAGLSESLQCHDSPSKEIGKLKQALSESSLQLLDLYELIEKQERNIDELEDKLLQLGSAPIPQEQEAETAKLKNLLAAKDKRILEYRRLNEDLKARISAPSDSGGKLEPSVNLSTGELGKQFDDHSLEELLAEVELYFEAIVAPKPPFEEMLWKEMEGMAHRLIKDYPQEVTPYGMLFEVAKKQGDVAMLKELAAVEHTDPEFTQLLDSVRAELRKMESVGKPFEMKFTAVDGREVDLAKMKGKVVLIDFWATWCGPCVAELPNLKKVYAELHGQGFEIIGISLDKEVKELTDFVASKDMPWAQFCDGKGWKSEIARKHAIGSIPAMFLVNKEGILVDLDARDDLEGKVRKYLAE